MSESDVVVIVEGFSRDDVYKTRYSLSTKAADSLASGASIFVYGSPECGIIEYMQSTHSAQVCTEKEKLTESLAALIQNGDIQRKYYDTAIEVSRKNHTLVKSSAVFEEVVNEAVKGGISRCR